ncbi:sugar phosphate isomerase/epimerase family protein [Draconibacterium mangrovi]|uniref:sugar phosphate isomerase/epimerase family protein n=1 Tax=Draconibacterium mangrovi TaxID=2697469 RepID=UPI0013D3FF04|nr:sugar phosphate isomerase/epimerase family protein [Draconibacterium mangrovi]
MKHLALVIFCLGLSSLLFAQSPKLKTSLNAYSFNHLLSEGQMNLDELLEFCAETGFDAVDLTAYYFPGYPAVPSNEVLYSVKRKAHELGLEISGTGVRNDFTSGDPKALEENIQLVKNWIIAAEKLGAPVLRIFAGQSNPGQFENQEIFNSMIAAIRECVEFGAEHGVIVAIQNHWQFIKTSDHVLQLFEEIHSEWFGLVLDVGSYRLGDPYQQIEASIPYAVNWQLKEMVYVNGEPVKTDLERIMHIIKASSYRGYVPIETLGEGDYKQKVKTFYQEVTNQLHLVNGQ